MVCLWKMVTQQGLHYEEVGGVVVQEWLVKRSRGEVLVIWKWMALCEVCVRNGRTHITEPAFPEKQQATR